jgi:hypothetical protein
MVEIQNCDVDAIPVPFSLLQQWVGTTIVEFSWLHYIPSVANVTVETKACSLLSGKMDPKALLA